MTFTPAYPTTLFSCLHDEQEPVGTLGRGTHYSVFRAVEWLDVVRTPLVRPEIHDFAVIWDEDHDARIVNAIEGIYMAGLMSPVQFVGERKGSLTVIVAAKFYFSINQNVLEDYRLSLEGAANAALGTDNWPTTLGVFHRDPDSEETNLQDLIAAEKFRVTTYVRNIDSLWSLGTKPFEAHGVHTT
jgi:hypothetical protein